MINLFIVLCDFANKKASQVVLLPCHPNTHYYAYGIVKEIA
jgi:hypothetical protein